MLILPCFSTSPSIYVYFSSMSAYDWCRTKFIPATMLTFRPGELSTVEQQGTNFAFKTNTYDFKDLPCPPRRVAVSHSKKSSTGRY